MKPRIEWLLLVAALLAWTAPGRANEPAPFAPHFEPAACGFAEVDASWARQHRIDCGWLHVLQTRDNPPGRKLKLWTAIARAAKRPTEPPLLYLHGGPGLGTVDYFFPYFPQSKTWPGFRASRDLIFFDQRGTGRSQPAFCVELKPALEKLRKRALPAAENLEQTRAAFAACATAMRAKGLVVGAYNSSATVEDAEDLRRALQIDHWSVYGVSYGSLVALDYLRRHPGSIHAAILDSVYPPNSVHGHEQITATAQAYAALQRACDRQPGCKARFPDIAARLAQATQRLDATPLASAKAGTITGARLREALWAMLVESDMVLWVPLAIERAAAGDAAVIDALVTLFGGFDGFGDYSPGQALAVNCHDVMAGKQAASVRLAQARYPWLADADSIAEEHDVLCAAWQAARAPMAFLAPVQSEVPTLLYGGEFDPATPYEDAVLAARHLTRATVVEVAGASHAVMGRDDCTRSLARKFLKDPAKTLDLSCLDSREPVVFQTDGLDGFLRSLASG